MKNSVRAVAQAIVAAGALASLTLAAPSPAQAAEGCTTSGARTVRTAVLFSRLFELRANDNIGNVCAWGRISNGSVGDLVWVDRSFDNKKSWQQLSITRINSGRSAFTDSWNDHNKFMRACGKAGDRDDVVCTDWW